MKTNYTFGRNIDNSTNELFSSRVNPRRPQDPYNLQNERGLSTLNKPHKFTVSWVYDLPKPDVTSGVAKVMLHGWQLNGVYIAESGQPITALSGVDANGDFDSAGDRAIFNPNGSGLTGSGVNYVIRNSVTGATSISTTNPGNALVAGYVARDPNARFIVAEAGALSTVGRNTINTLGLNNWDLSVFKNTRLSEKVTLQCRTEFFNLLNHRQRSLGSGSYQQLNTNALSTSYANVSAQRFLDNGQFSGGSRSVQLALKLIF